MTLVDVLTEENTLAGTSLHHWRNMREMLTLKAIEGGDFSNSVEALEKREARGERQSFSYREALMSFNRRAEKVEDKILELVSSSE